MGLLARLLRVVNTEFSACAIELTSHEASDPTDKLREIRAYVTDVLLWSPGSVLTLSMTVVKIHSIKSESWTAGSVTPLLKKVLTLSQCRQRPSNREVAYS